MKTQAVKSRLPKPYYEREGVTLFNADCLEILPLLEPGSVDAVVTDPPYGIGFVKSSCNRGTGFGFGGNKIRRSGTQPICNDDRPFDPAPMLNYPIVLLWGADHFKRRLPDGGTLIGWDKHLGRGPNDDFCDCEFAWTNQTKIKRNVIRFLWKGAACQKAGEHKGNGAVTREHPSQKPIGVMIQCLELTRVPVGVLVCDPFSGSGTTGVACIRTGRKFIGIEICEKYAEIAARRFEAEANRFPLLEPQPKRQRELIEGCHAS